MAVIQALYRLAALKWLGVLLCGWAVLFAPVEASAQTRLQTKTRDWGFELSGEPCIGGIEAVSAGKHQGIGDEYDEVASGFPNFVVGVAAIWAAKNLADKVGPIDPNKPAQDVLPGSLKREFPSEYLDKSLNQIKEMLRNAGGEEKRDQEAAGTIGAAIEEKQMTSWVSAKLIFRAEVDDEQTIAPLWEESIRVLTAENEDDAQVKAVEIGNKEQHSYKNEAASTVSWKFVEVGEIQDLCVVELEDGAEVYSRLYRSEKPESVFTSKHGKYATRLAYGPSYG